MEAQENEGNMESVKTELLRITNNFWQALADRDIKKGSFNVQTPLRLLAPAWMKKLRARKNILPSTKKGLNNIPKNLS
jgi:hypothetical protein